jgi:hypothetical protein
MCTIIELTSADERVCNCGYGIIHFFFYKLHKFIIWSYYISEAEQHETESYYVCRHWQILGLCRHPLCLIVHTWSLIRLVLVLFFVLCDIMVTAA